MNIVLSWIPGINRIDTPRFSTIENQTNWFDSRVNIVIIYFFFSINIYTRYFNRFYCFILFSNKECSYYRYNKYYK